MLTSTDNDVQVLGVSVQFPDPAHGGDLPPNNAGDELSGWDGDREPCGMPQATLTAHFDNQIGSPQAAAIAEHVQGCKQCAWRLASLKSTDDMLKREWRDQAPLPDSFKMKRSVDAIMAALPDSEPAVSTFAPKRVHHRHRWTRFTAAVAASFAAFAATWAGVVSLTQRRPGVAISRASQLAAPADAQSVRAHLRSALVRSTRRP